MSLNSPILLASCSVLAAGAVIVAAFRRNHGFHRADAGGVFVALTSGFMIPKGLFLCSYLLDPDPLTVATKLRGYEKEIFAAGGLIIFLAVVSIWSQCKPPAATHTPNPQPPASGPSASGK